MARFQMLLPSKRSADHLQPVCIHLAGTGDHYFWRRRMLMAKPLLKHGIASILLENPFYGLRKPVSQKCSSLHNVSDIFVMGGCLVLESLALFHWCEAQGFGPLAITGISMGGHMASLAGSNWHKPLAIIPCLSWTTASSVFTQGVMSGAIPWNLLESQYFSDQIYKEEIWKLVHSPEDNNAFIAGQHFARNYPESMDQVKRLEAEQSILKLKEKNISQTYGFFTTSKDDRKSVDNFLSTRQSSPIFTDSAYGTRTKRKLQDGNQTAKIPDYNNMSKRETMNFMRGIMDECTHLGNFSVPVDPTLSIVVAARKDAYVLQNGIKSLPDLWPGCEVRYLDCGHIAAFLFNQGVFRKAIIDGIERTANKYFQNLLPNKCKETA